MPSLLGHFPKFTHWNFQRSFLVSSDSKTTLAKEIRKYSLYSKWPCVQLKEVKDSMTKGVGEIRHWQTRVVSHITMSPPLLCSKQDSRGLERCVNYSQRACFKISEKEESKTQVGILRSPQNEVNTIMPMIGSQVLSTGNSWTWFSPF